MSNTETTFRSAAFGGFQRGDVLDYITKMTQAHQAESSRLTAQVEELQRRLSEVEDNQWELDNLKKRCETLEQENRTQKETLTAGAEDREKLEELQLQFQILEEENTALKEEINTLRRENGTLNQELDRCQPNLQAYTAIRDQVADIEMDARTHSYAIRSKAEAEAEQVYHRANSVLERTRRSFDTVKVDVESTVAHLLGELHRTEAVLAGLEGTMDANEAELAELKVEWEAEEDE